MKKTALPLILAASIVAAPLATAAPAFADTNKAGHSVVTQDSMLNTAGPVFVSDQPVLTINASNSGAFLTTQSGNVSVHWSKHRGMESNIKPYFVTITQTNPARMPYITIATKAGRNAVVKLMHTTRDKIEAGKPGFSSVQAFVKAVKAAAKKR